MAAGHDVRPPFLYGTAWKEDETRRLVRLALEAGFRGIDTANQRKHYFEAAVGEAVADAVRDGLVTRDALFLQTKYTFRAGQDQRLPYDPAAPIRTQVRQSFDSSLEHLGTDRIDAYVLHGPSRRSGLHDADREAWAEMEALHREGRARLLGVSNVDADQLEQLCAAAAVPPTFVQNRCYAQLGWDAEVRAICRARGLVYQGFSLLTANGFVLSHPQVAAVARRLGATTPQVVFAFALAVGMLPLTGTTSETHMRQDLAAASLALEPSEVALVEAIAS